MGAPEGGVPTGTAGAALLSRAPRLTSNHERRHAVADRDGWYCAYCEVGLVCWCQVPIVAGRRTEPRASEGRQFATLDHVDPRPGRGRNKLPNLVLACLSCNSKKGTRHHSVMDR